MARISYQLAADIASPCSFSTMYYAGIAGACKMAFINLSLHFKRKKP